jgi:hypothetical protein
MKQSITQNGIELRTEHVNGLRQAVLITPTRIVQINREYGGSWTISLSKRTQDEVPNISLRTYTNVTMSDAIGYFEKKQYEYGFFNDQA